MNNLLLSLLVAILYGFWVFAQKMATKTLTPFSLQFVIALSWSAIAPIMILLTKSNKIKADLPWNGVSWGIVTMLTALLAGYIFNLVLKRADNSAAIIGITSAYPAIAVLLCHFFLNEKLTVQHGIGLLITIVGVIILSI